MTRDAFNEKYNNHIEHGFYGLEFDIPVVTELLDKKFEEFTKVEGFKFSQIKLKFNMARFYAEPHSLNTHEIERQINILVELYDWAVERGWWYEDGYWRKGDGSKLTTDQLFAAQAKRLHR